MNNIFQLCCSDICWIFWIVRIFCRQCMNDTNFTLVALVLIELNGTGMGDHHVVMGLENLGQVILDTWREFSN